MLSLRRNPSFAPTPALTGHRLTHGFGLQPRSHTRRPSSTAARPIGGSFCACPMRPLAAADKMQAGPLTPALTGRLFLPVRSAASIAQPLAATDDNCRKAELNHHVGGVLRGCYIYEKAGKDPFGSSRLSCLPRYPLSWQDSMNRRHHFCKLTQCLRGIDER